MDDFSFDMHLSADELVGFGKYRHLTWAELHQQDPDYLKWVRGKDDFAYAHDVIDELFIGPPIDLTTLAVDQREAFEQAVEKLLKGPERVFRLDGGAGYGKSYTVATIVKAAKREGYSVAAMATSYVATQVMAQGLDPLGVPCATIARSLALRPDYSKPNKDYGPSDDTPEALWNLLGGGKKLLVVDEYSMVAHMVVDLVYEQMNEPGCEDSKLLVVGDDAQLPAPKQEDLCRFGVILPRSNLTVPKRFEPGGVLHSLELDVRANPANLAELLTAKADGFHVCRHQRAHDLYEQLAEDTLDFPDQTAVALAYTNQAVNEINLAVRKRLAPGDEPLVNNELLRVMRTTFMPDPMGGPSLRFYSGTTLRANDPRIEPVHLEIDDQKYTVECYVTADGIPLIFFAGDDKVAAGMVGSESFTAALRQAKAYAGETGNWAHKHRFTDHFLPIHYAYAMTIHRSQGGSYDRVYFDPRQVYTGGRDAPKLAYVAATRARKQVHFN